MRSRTWSDSEGVVSALFCEAWVWVVDVALCARVLRVCHLLWTSCWFGWRREEVEVEYDGPVICMVNERDGAVDE